MTDRTPDLDESLRLFVDHLSANPELLALAAEHRGLTFACHCKAGVPCHAEVLAAIADDDPVRLAEVLRLARAGAA